MTKKEIRVLNQNLKTIAVNQAMIYALLQRLTEQLDHSSTANTPQSDR